MLAQQSNSHLKILNKFQMWMKDINRLYHYIYIQYNIVSMRIGLGGNTEHALTSWSFYVFAVSSVNDQF